METNVVMKKFLVVCLAVMLLVATIAILAGCNEDKIKSVTITTNPIKTTYLAGEKFDTTGMIITVAYKDGTSEAIKFADNNDPKNEGYTYNLYKKGLKVTDTQVVFSFKGKDVALKIIVEKRNVDAPKTTDITYTALNRMIVVTPIGGAEYKLNEREWQDSNFFGDLDNGSTYKLSVRLKESDEYYASEITVVESIKVMGTQTAISDTILDITTTGTSITVAEITGAEYKLDDGEWGSQREFTGLTANTLHTVYVRMAETDKLLASEQTAKSVITRVE